MSCDKGGCPFFSIRCHQPKVNIHQNENENRTDMLWLGQTTSNAAFGGIDLTVESYVSYQTSSTVYDPSQAVGWNATYTKNRKRKKRGIAQINKTSLRCGLSIRMLLFILVSIKYPLPYFEVRIFFISLIHQVQVQITYECLDTRFFSLQFHCSRPTMMQTVRFDAIVECLFVARLILIRFNLWGLRHSVPTTQNENNNHFMYADWEHPK